MGRVVVDRIEIKEENIAIWKNSLMIMQDA